MKILFVYTDINVRGGAMSYQFGTGVMSAVLKAHGYDTRLHHMFGAFDMEPLRRVVAEYRPDVVGMSVVYPQWRYAKKIIEELRPWQAFTIFGGAHPTVVPDCLSQVEALDAICVGEGEYPRDRGAHAPDLRGHDAGVCQGTRPEAQVDPHAVLCAASFGLLGAHGDADPLARGTAAD